MATTRLFQCAIDTCWKQSSTSLFPEAEYYKMKGTMQVFEISCSVRQFLFLSLFLKFVKLNRLMFNVFDGFFFSDQQYNLSYKMCVVIPHVKNVVRSVVTVIKYVCQTV